MLTEIEIDRECGAVGYSRHFAGSGCDLTVWYNIDGKLNGFSLKCAGDIGTPLSVSWVEGKGYYVEDSLNDNRSGNEKSKKADTRNKQLKYLAESFRVLSAAIDRSVSSFVIQKLRNFP
jgi:hypothetical protein